MPDDIVPVFSREAISWLTQASFEPNELQFLERSSTRYCANRQGKIFRPAGPSNQMSYDSWKEAVQGTAPIAKAKIFDQQALQTK